MRKNEVLQYLQNLELFGTQLGLGRIEMLLSELGNPEQTLKAIHVAGTNGKGSVCAMINTILQNAGYRVGMYTSPHLVDFKERFLINNKKISEKDVVKQVETLKPIAEKVKEKLSQPTYFEVTTAVAFNYFAEQEVDYAVIETGLGGRLDATNVISPLASIITNIDFEHTDYLGNTLEKIAYEKACIIKKNKPTITAAVEPALSVIKDVCSKKNSKLIVVDKKYNGQLSLRGEFQKINASVAVETIKELDIGVEKDVLETALQKVKWPARLDMRKIKGRQILFDSAHNPACVRVLLPELKNFQYDKLILVAGILKDKDYKEMLELLETAADEIILTKPQIERAQEPGILAKSLKKEPKIILNSNFAVDYALNSAKKDDLILITGSMYLVGESMAYLNAKVF